jgi:CDP-6-deoxy-D-xylo-4-hexulose-3-dehydrase
VDSDLTNLILEYGDKVIPFVPGETFISVDGSVSNGDESVNLINSILGEDKNHLQSFTTKMFSYLGGGHVNIVGSSTSAHILTMKALCHESFGGRGLKAGDEIITTANNVGVINAARMCGIIPVVVDVDLNTLLPSPVDIEAAIEEGKTKAIVLTSPNGNPTNGETIRNIADEFSIMYIEDVGCGFGGRSHTVPIGDFADIAIYSFSSNLLGDAGVIVSKSILFYKLVQRMMDTEAGSHLALGLGSNKMMLAYLDAQMDKIDYYISMRKLNWERLHTGLSKYDKWLRFQTGSEFAQPSWSGFLITLKEPYDYVFSRTQLMEFLADRKIGCRCMVGNVFQSSPYNANEYRTVGELMTSDYIHKNSFVVGCNATMHEEHIIYIISAFDEFFEKIGQKLNENPQD